ncbi:MAG: hypothetical protein BIP78_0992 [Candidatus Bipolaricaulis sibiricus]|uniref:Uncharacterized protein n=1 Tax=Bipolaricaulis sibiricus TaxID=2501609 RepID=A0A410FUY4_BIPS1|nr:MAG: hypothetical protein BIP78_0992 [Candidatus Bipolaricaulis sibiricus]
MGAPATRLEPDDGPGGRVLDRFLPRPPSGPGRPPVVSHGGLAAELGSPPVINRDAVQVRGDLPSEATVGVSLIWRGCCQAESAQWTWRLVRSGPAVDAIPPQPRADELPWGWILVGGILAVGLIAILLQL